MIELIEATPGSGKMLNRGGMSNDAWNLLLCVRQLRGLQRRGWEHARVLELCQWRAWLLISGVSLSERMPRDSLRP